MKPETEYRRQLVEAVLARNEKPMTAGEVLEQMGALAQAEGHPDSCWRSLTTQMVAGALRNMEQTGESVQRPPVPSGRRGRPDPRWQRTAETCSDIPAAPHHEAAPMRTPRAALQAFPSGAVDLESCSPAQLQVVLNVADMLAGAIERVARDLNETREKARAQLAKAGVA
jgi:hypothetical protein